MVRPCYASTAYSTAYGRTYISKPVGEHRPRIGRSLTSAASSCTNADCKTKMRCSLLLSLRPAATLAAVAVAAVVSGQSPLPTPQFEPLFAGQITITSGRNTTGPFGTRVHYAISG